MSRSFRFEPPEPRADLLLRPRLLQSLRQRWHHRITYLTGGPGLGKTTLLAQAIADNRLAPQGDDVWIAIESSDADADHLAHVVATAVAEPGSDRADDIARARATVAPSVVANALWQRAPTEACLVLDDVHLVPPRSTGAAWLGELIEAMPANGHLVFASRAEPPMSLSRYRGQGAVLQLLEDDLRFSEDELRGFADRRGVDREQFAATGGWPAMAELAASTGTTFTGTYLWEQVLEPLGSFRRQVLAVVCELGSADDALASAALGMPVALAEVLGGVPLVSRRAGGWHVPHDLWRSAPGVALDATERAATRRRAAAHLVERRKFDEAFGLLGGAQLWDEVPSLLRAACLASQQVPASDLGRWIAACPDDVRSSSAKALATAFHVAMKTPGKAAGPLVEAIVLCRSEGDVDAELAAVAQLALEAWSSQERSLLEEQTPRVAELAEAGYPVARALMELRAAFIQDILGNDDGVLEHLGRIEPGVLPGVSDVMVAALSAGVQQGRGHPDETLEIVERVSPLADPAIRWLLEAMGVPALQAVGFADEAHARVDGFVAAARAAGIETVRFLVANVASLICAHVGDVVGSRRYLDEAMTMFRPGTRRLPELSALSTASLQVAEGDEPAAAATLADTIAHRGIDRGLVRRWWRHSLAMTYVVSPEARAHWDAAPLQGRLATAREVAALVVLVRQGDASARLRTVGLPDVDLLRGALHHRHAAELAVALAAVGRPEGPALLDTLGRPGRDAVRALTEGPRQARDAKALLAAAPAPPPRSTYLAALGPISLRRDGRGGEEVVHPDLRRQRVQALFGFLVNHRQTSRGVITATLWPEMDERAAANNLAVTLNCLLRLLDPWRTSGEPPYQVRLDGPTVRLISDEHLAIDVDEFDAHRSAATRAEDEAGPSAALDHHLAAIDIYRGDLCVDVHDAEWLTLPREHYRTRFVNSAVRAAQLLLAQNDTDRAEAVAHRALAADAWAEDAYAVLIGVALLRRDRSAAHRLLGLCLEALGDLGVEPSDVTHQLRRRVAEA